MAAKIPSSPLAYLIFLSIFLTSPQNSLPSTTELIFPLLPLSSLCIIPVIFPSFFHWWPINLLHFSIFPRFPTSALHTVVPPLDPAAPSLFATSSCVSVWCVCLWSFCSTVHPVDRKHPVHHHSQLPVGSAGSGGPICVNSCQITEVWLCRICPTPNSLPGDWVGGALGGKVPVGTALHWLPYPQERRRCHHGLSWDGSASLLRKDRGGPCLRWDG